MQLSPVFSTIQPIGCEDTCLKVAEERVIPMLDRKFTAAAPNRIWLADITYIETDQGWLYLAAVMDLYSRRIVGWAMEDHLRAELPLAALTMAISTQRAGAGLVHHSDRGVQYAAADYRKVLQSAGLDEPQSRLL